MVVSVVGMERSGQLWEGLKGQNEWNLVNDCIPSWEGEGRAAHNGAICQHREFTRSQAFSQARSPSLCFPLWVLQLSILLLAYCRTHLSLTTCPLLFLFFNKKKIETLVRRSDSGYEDKRKRSSPSV